MDSRHHFLPQGSEIQQSNRFPFSNNYSLAPPPQQLHPRSNNPSYPPTPNFPPPISSFPPPHSSSFVSFHSQPSFLPSQVPISHPASAHHPIPPPRPASAHHSIPPLCAIPPNQSSNVHEQRQSLHTFPNTTHNFNFAVPPPSHSYSVPPSQQSMLPPSNPPIQNQFGTGQVVYSNRTIPEDNAKVQVISASRVDDPKEVGKNKVMSWLQKKGKTKPKSTGQIKEKFDLKVTHRDQSSYF